MLGQGVGSLWPMAHTAWPPRGSAEPRAPGSGFHMTRASGTSKETPAFLGGCFPGFSREIDCSRNLRGGPLLAEVVALVRDPSGEERKDTGDPYFG